VMRPLQSWPGGTGANVSFLLNLKWKTMDRMRFVRQTIVFDQWWQTIECAIQWFPKKKKADFFSKRHSSIYLTTPEVGKRHNFPLARVFQYHSPWLNCWKARMSKEEEKKKNTLREKSMKRSNDE
jgi:hypothetical protein